MLGRILTSVVGQFLLHHGLGSGGATQGALACATSVLSTALFEAVFLGETLSANALLGVAVALAATKSEPLSSELG